MFFKFIAKLALNKNKSFGSSLVFKNSVNISGDSKWRAGFVVEATMVFASSPKHKI